MKKVMLFLMLVLFAFGGSGFSIQNIENRTPHPTSCWDFADHEAAQPWYSDQSYAENYETWLWHYDYCMDGLYAPALIVPGAYD